MEVRDYEIILNSLHTVGVFVIREDNHEILYYNKWIEDREPGIALGDVCHELWSGSCRQCPLLKIGKRKEARATIYESPFGKIIDIMATRILWQDTVPAFSISVAPRDEGELEEIIVQNQEIIKTLGELNFGVHVIDLNSGVFHPVRATDEVKDILKSDILKWDELLKIVQQEFFHPDYQKELWKACSLEGIRRLWRSGEKRQIIVSRRLMGDIYRYVEIAVNIYKGGNGSHYAVIAFQDVDERTRREIQRYQNDMRMSAIVRSRYDFMETVHLDTGMCERIDLKATGDFSNAQTGVYEYFIRKAAEESVYEEDVTYFLDVFSLEHLREFASHVSGSEERVVQYRLKGEPVTWLEQRLFFLRQQEIMMVNILGRDITEEKQREDFISREKKDHGQIISSMSQMFFATYFMNLENGTYRAVAQIDEVGGVLGEEANIRQGFRRYAEHFVHPDDREEYLAAVDLDNIRARLSKMVPYMAVEYRRIRLQDGEIKDNGWIRATIVMAGEQDGKATRALYVVQDVTDVKEKEAREQQMLKDAYEAALQANASKSDFLSKMSHDIRTPMNAIIGMTAIASTRLDDRDRVADCLNKITISSKHLLALINEVLDMSKIESGKMDLAQEDFNLADLMQGLLTMIRPTVLDKGHELSFHISHIVHEDVVGDVLRLQQVFMNILGNAVKYTPPGGHLELEISEQPSQTFGYGHYTFVFKDNGIGMSKEYVEQIFEPFSRAEDSRVSKIEGTGLGMAIALNIVHMMNGTIQVESEEGKGSKFTVSVFLKFQDTDIVGLERLAELPVLVVDDEQCDCEAACEILNDVGMRSEYVLSGREAVERVKRAHSEEADFFAVILDWKMPDMDGLQTAKAIRQAVGPDVPIIILSAFDWSDVETEARQAGINGFISKPLFKSRLVYLFKQLINEEQTEEEEEPAIRSMSEDDFTGRRILVVEDIELNREVAEQIIGSMGVTVECVVNGKEAVDRFNEVEEWYYDLIFMDVQMPVMNGLEATEAIRKLNRGDAKDIPIIAMTANAFAEDAAISYKAGMNEHITKPLDIAQLMECMRRWFAVRKS